MKKLIVLALLFTMGCAAKPKYHYNTCVRIVDDFYGPTYGVLLEYNGFGGMYTVLRKIGNVQKQWVISENLLTPVDSSYCQELSQ